MCKDDGDEIAWLEFNGVFSLMAVFLRENQETNMRRITINHVYIRSIAGNARPRYCKKLSLGKTRCVLGSSSDGEDQHTHSMSQAGTPAVNDA